MPEIPADVLARIPKLMERIRASASGYVRVARFSVPDRTALAVAIERGELEIFDSAMGRAYRLKKPVPVSHPRSRSKNRKTRA